LALTQPQYDLLSHLGSTETGLELEFVRHERGRTSVLVGDRKFQPRTAEALIEQCLLEVIATVDDDPKPGETFLVCRLSPAGWNAIGVPVKDSPPLAPISVGQYLKREKAEDAPVVQPPSVAGHMLAAALSAVGSVVRASKHTPYTTKKREERKVKTRRKVERTSRRQNRVRR
jgi:hypothetical protein